LKFEVELGELKKGQGLRKKKPGQKNWKLHHYSGYVKNNK
jgi:hypothetical protein